MVVFDGFVHSEEVTHLILSAVTVTFSSGDKILRFGHFLLVFFFSHNSLNFGIFQFLKFELIWIGHKRYGSLLSFLRFHLSVVKLKQPITSSDQLQETQTVQ